MMLCTEVFRISMPKLKKDTDSLLML